MMDVRKFPDTTFAIAKPKNGDCIRRLRRFPQILRMGDAPSLTIMGAPGSHSNQMIHLRPATKSKVPPCQFAVPFCRFCGGAENILVFYFFCGLVAFLS